MANPIQSTSSAMQHVVQNSSSEQNSLITLTQEVANSHLTPNDQPIIVNPPQITTLPDNLTINGPLYLGNAPQLTALPHHLTIIDNAPQFARAH